MNKARLLLLILGLSLLSGSVCMHPATLRVAELRDGSVAYLPEHYYEYAPVIPDGMDPYEWLGSDLEWADEYVVNTWDCSKMAAYLEWVLENSGVQTEIHARLGHAWLMVWREDKEQWWAYECVSLRWIDPWIQDTYYDATFKWDNVYELRWWYGYYPWPFAWEWCWWADTSGIDEMEAH